MHVTTKLTKVKQELWWEAKVQYKEWKRLREKESFSLPEIHVLTKKYTDCWALLFDIVYDCNNP